MFTFTTMTAKISELDSLNFETANRLHRQLRNFYAKGLLTGSGTGSAITFDTLALYQARLLNILAEQGYDVGVLAEVAAAMHRNDTLAFVTVEHRAPSLKIDGGWKSRGALKDAIAGIAAGEKWSLHLILRNSTLKSIRTRSAHFVWDGSPIDEDAARILDSAIGLKRHEVVQSDTKLSLNKLFAGLPPLDD